jgi:hypothetical protein
VSLADWQRDLAARIAAPHAAAAGDLDHPGLALTRMLQRNWRHTRLTHALPLTMRVLPAGARQRMLSDYCDVYPCVSFFPAHDARGFAEFLVAAGDQPHVASIAALEVAMIDAFEAGVFGDVSALRADAHGPLRLARGASRVRFTAPPELVLATALARRELPPAAEEHELLVAPGIPGLVRSPSASERQLLDSCAEGLEEVPVEFTGAAATLLAERVLVRMT